MTGSERVDLRAALDVLNGTGLTLADAARLAVQARPERPASTELRAGVDRFMASRAAANLRGTSVRWYETRLGLLLRGMGETTHMDAVTRAHLENIGRDIRNETTRCSYYRAWRALWRWAAKQSPKLATTDPTEGLSVTPHRRDNAGAAFLSVEDCARIMAGVGERHQSAAALLLFAGLRPQELWGTDKQPMLWRSINPDERIIRVPAAASKTRKDRILEGLPATVWRFLRPGKPEQPICPCRSQQLIRRMQVAAGFRTEARQGDGVRPLIREWPHDVTRHTFAGYALAHTSDPSRVALWLGHEGRPSMLYRHYRGLVTRSEAKAFFELAAAGSGAAVETGRL